MDSEVSIRLSRGKILLAAAALSVVAALVFGVFAVMSTIGSNEDDLRIRINEIEAKSRTMPDGPEERDALLEELNDELLEIIESSDDPLIESVAYLNLGTLPLEDFKRAIDEYEALEKQYSFNKPSRVRLDSAIVYFQKAVRICADQEDRSLCSFDEIQRRLDYAKGLLQKYFGDSADLGGGDDTSEESANEDSQKQDSEERRGARVPGENQNVEGDYSRGPEALDDAATEESSNVQRGSIRGKLSKEPDYEPYGADPAYSFGSGYRPPPNRP